MNSYAATITYTNISGNGCYTFSVPNGSTGVSYSLSKSAGNSAWDFDLYYWGTTATCNTATGWVCRPYLGAGSTETCGTYTVAGTCGPFTTYYCYVSKWAGDAASRATLTCTYTPPVATNACNIAAETGAMTAATGCTAGNIPLGSGAYRDVPLAANTYYNFSWANNSGGTTSGFCASVISGGAGATSSSFSANQTAWFSGTTAPTLRVSANRSNCTWSATSAVMTYQHTTPNATTVSGSATVCSTGTITASGGGNGIMYWEGTTSNGTSTATPSSSQSVGAGTYYFRSGNNGCWGPEGSATIVAATNNPGALSVPATICAGTTTNIANATTATGGPGAATYYYYYRGGPGNISWTMYDGPTSNLTSTLPAAVTNTPGTWYVARNSDFGCGQANNASTVDIPMVVAAPSTAPTGIAGAGVTICHGNAVTLSPSGGSLSTGASYQWYTGSCGGTLIGTGNSISVSPTTTTQYWVRAGAGTSCAATACATGTISLPTAGTALAGNGESATCNVSGSGWIHFYSSAGNLIASINPNGNNLGSVTATAYVNGSSILTQACNTGTNPSYTTAALGRRWVITPTNNMAANVKFPFATSELTSLITSSVTSTPSNLLDNIGGLANLKMSRYSGVNQNGNWADNCVTAGGSGGTILYGTQIAQGAVATGAGFVTNIATANYVEFSTPGFSEFWLHGDGGSSPLPVELTNLSATCSAENEVDVNWSTASELNSQKFIIERSRNIDQWEYVAEHAAAGNSNYNINYTVSDSDPFSGISYYRLRQIDNDGEEKIYGPVSISCAGDENSMIVFPNPTKGSFTVAISSSESISNAEIMITDLSGKVLSTRSLNIFEGNNQIMFDAVNLQLGTYIVKLASSTEFKPVMVVVAN